MAGFTYKTLFRGSLLRVSASAVALVAALSLGSLAYAEDALISTPDADLTAAAADAVAGEKDAQAAQKQDASVAPLPLKASPDTTDEGDKAPEGESEDEITESITTNVGAGGSAEVPSTAKVGDTVTVKATPDKGYKLAKVTWENNDHVVEDITEKLSFTMTAGGGTVTVTFEELATYKVTVVATPKEGGTATASAASGYTGDSIDLNATPAKGYYLVGWKVSAGTTVVIDESKASTSLVLGEEDVTVTATFDKDPEQVHYTITFDPNGGKGSMKSLSVKGGTSVALTANAFTRKNSEFIGWNTAADGSGTDYADQAEVKPTGNLTLYALWDTEEEEEDEAFYITFDANGGSGEMDDLEVEPGSSAKLTANAYKRSGYTFTGWNTKADGSGKAYADKASVKPKADMTLYAQWKKNAPAKKDTPKKTVRLLPKTGDPFSVMACAAAAIVGGGLVLVGRKMRDR